MYKGQEVYIKGNCPDSKYHYMHGQVASKRHHQVTVLFHTKRNGRNRYWTAEFHKAYVAVKGIDYC